MIAIEKVVGRSGRTPRVLAAAAVLGVLFAGVGRAGEYTADPVHSRIGFSISHMAISTVSGRFTNYTARIGFDKDAMDSLTGEAAIQVASIDTDVEQRDAHLRSPDFFDAAKFPEIRFEGGKAEKEGSGWVLVGKFTMHGTTRALRLPVTVAGPVADMQGNQRIGFHAKTTINRHDYGVGSDKMVDKMVGDDVTLAIDVEAVAKKK